ncbi:MAG: hypothetical protein ACRCVJ_15890 [Clostridium sp.]|uniref:hypothetical protein n=1 Tax=Clostridium sp. TaxID=1506 RepID=UPI003F3C7393
MKLDLYTLYVYNYAKEFLFSKNVDLLKIKEFSNCSNAIFIDEFCFKKVIGNNILEFYSYLKRRKCFKANMLIQDDEILILKFWCNFSLEYWHCHPVLKKDGQLSHMEFKKIKEDLWAKKYLDLTKEEEEEWRIRFKKNNYVNN